MFCPRYNDRYVRNKVSIEGLGLCFVELSVCGFGESLSIYLENGDFVFYGESLDDDYDEDNSYFYFTVGCPYYDDYKIKKRELYKKG